MSFRTIALVFVALIILAACGSDDSDAGEPGGAVVVSDAWSRPVQLLDEHEHDAEATVEEGAGAGTNGVVYLTVANESDNDDRLMSVSSAVASSAELHTVNVADRVMQMRQAEDGIEVPAGETVTLEPTGMHIMLIGLTRTLEVGDTFDISLAFEQAGERIVQVEVRDQ